MINTSNTNSLFRSSSTNKYNKMNKTTNRRQTKDSEFTTGSNVRLDYSNLSELQSRNNHDLESNYTAK